MGTAGFFGPCSTTIEKETGWTRTASKIAFDDPERFGKAVHLADIHLEKGMQLQRLPLRAGQSR